MYGLFFYVDCIASFNKSIAKHLRFHFLFIVAMFFTGSVWVYRTSPDSQVLHNIITLDGVFSLPLYDVFYILHFTGRWK